MDPEDDSVAVDFVSDPVDCVLPDTTVDEPDAVDAPDTVVGGTSVDDVVRDPVGSDFSVDDVGVSDPGETELLPDTSVDDADV